MENIQAGTTEVTVVTRIAIFNMAKEFLEKDLGGRLDLVQNYYVKKPSFAVERKDDFLKKFAKLKYEIKSRWQAAGRSEVVFINKNKNWLEGTIDIPMKACFHDRRRPRPHKSFDDLTDRSKRRRTQSLREHNETQEVLYAGQMMLREMGNVGGANVVKDIMATSTKENEDPSSSPSASSSRKLTPEQALSMFVEAGLTRKQYEIIRACDTTLFPCYSLIQKEKKKCYPDEESVIINSVSAEVKLQSLLDHTVERLLKFLDNVLDALSPEELGSLQLIYKWGCDGSHQKQFKQKFDNSADSDAHIFQSSIVPLRLICRHSDKIVWQNPTPSSPRFCRPMRIRFVHENKDITNEEIEYFNNQIKELESTISKRGDLVITVAHTMLLTMVDGKVCNAATQTASTMRCFICKLTSKDFNDLEKVRSKEVCIDNLEFGLSILHARIRLFESLLHLSYKLSFQKWQVRSQDDKDEVKKRKEEIQKIFRDELGLIVDVPKPGFGSSNDGNTSRRFFANAEVSARITGIDQNLINRFAVILETISSGHEIDVTKFAMYCEETAELYVSLYPWHPMTPTVHKILMHGPTVIQHAILPIGSLSEEAAEARNKHFRQFRESYSRKFSREQCNTDVINRLLLTSDPFLSSIRKKQLRNSKHFQLQPRTCFYHLNVSK